MALQRRSDWREQLDRMVTSARDLPFEWGTFDCALHAADCVRAITRDGHDFAAEHRGKYKTEADAAVIYGTNLQTFIATLLTAQGCVEVSTSLARRGDIVWIKNGTAQGAIGVVCSDGRFASCPTDAGLVMVRRHRWGRAWQIG